MRRAFNHNALLLGKGVDGEGPGVFEFSKNCVHTLTHVVTHSRVKIVYGHY